MKTPVRDRDVTMNSGIFLEFTIFNVNDGKFIRVDKVVPKQIGEFNVYNRDGGKIIGYEEAVDLLKKNLSLISADNFYITPFLSYQENIMRPAAISSNLRDKCANEKHNTEGQVNYKECSLDLVNKYISCYKDISNCHPSL